MSYENYMREVLGYVPNGMQDSFSSSYYAMPSDTMMYPQQANLENLYPDTYRKIYPLVCKECNTNTMPMTEEILEQMTDRIYDAIEIDLKIETKTQVEINSKNANMRGQEDRQTRRRNNTLRDLIKILIINQLLNGGFPGNRPPFPGGPVRPPRPPFPGGNRPPFPR